MEVEVASDLEGGYLAFDGAVDFIEDCEGSDERWHEHVGPSEVVEVLSWLEASHAHNSKEEDIKGQNHCICNKVQREVGILSW